MNHPISSLSLSHHSRFCSIGTETGDGYLYDIREKNITRLFHGNGIVHTAISPNEDICAYASSDKIVLISLNDKETIWSSQWIESYIRSLTFSHNGQYLAACGRTNNDLIFDVGNGMSFIQMESLTHGKALSFSIDDRYIFDYPPTIIDWKQRREVSKIECTSTMIEGLLFYSTFIDNENIMLTTCEGVLSFNINYLDKIQSISSKEKQNAQINNQITEYKFGGSVPSCIASQDGDLLVKGADDGTVTIVKLSSHEIINKYYIIPKCYIKGCVFNGIIADKTTYGIISQYD